MTTQGHDAWRKCHSGHGRASGVGGGVHREPHSAALPRNLKFKKYRKDYFMALLCNASGSLPGGAR